MFSNSCQWFWSPWTLKRDSPTEWVFSHSHQWFWSPQTQQTHILDECSAILVSNSGLLKHTGEQTHILDEYLAILVIGSDLLKHWRAKLTCWMGVWSVILISGSNLLKHWKANLQAKWVFSHSHQCFWSTQKLERKLTSWIVIQPFSSEVLIHSNSEEQTHFLDILISSSDLLKHQRWTHPLDGCSTILVSGSDLLKHQRGNSLAGYMFSSSCQWFWFAQTMESKLTIWMHVQPFSSVVLICSNSEEQTHSLDNLISSSGLYKDWRANSLAECMFSHSLSVALIFSNTGEWTHMLNGNSAICYVSGSDLLKHWQVTNFLNVSNFFISEIHNHLRSLTDLSFKALIKFQ